MQNVTDNRRQYICSSKRLNSAERLTKKNMSGFINKKAVNFLIVTVIEVSY